jgi:SAM-dependent methyltransferase
MSAMGKDSLLRACPVCQNGVVAELLYTQKFALPDNQPLPGEYDVVACGRCGFVYADTPADQNAYDKYYAEMSRYDMNYICANSSLYIDRAAWINMFIRYRTNSIIDIGCGNGQLLLELQKLSLSDLTGLDPSEKCISDLKKKRINGITSSIFSVSTDRKYDCAILSGVLEHIYDVNGIIEIIKQLLKHSGLLFVCVPDASRYQDYDSVPFDYFNIEHINHFDEISLLSLGLLHGFRMVSFFKTTIMLAQTTQPVIFCVYENEGKPVTSTQSYAMNCVGDYIRVTQNNLRICHIIDPLIETKEEIIVWGAGNYTSRLLANSGLEKCNIAMVVDNDRHKQGTVIGGKVVYPPIAIREMGKSPVILICAAVFCDEIIAEIGRMGLKNKVITLGNTRIQLT